ncbi:MAG: hypothetical protein BMS9Abin20_0276 [Acidimicrobiia bacterium]|nr:MAG: hypothetical protein BMS9Abin20_0276 [Acidimicrobiia bacterium]
MITVIVAAIVAFLVIGIVLSRQTKHRKQEAIDDLKREREEIEHIDIFTLIAAEIDELDLRSITGADDLQPAVLLKAWKDNLDVVKRCRDRAGLRFVVTHGVSPDKATNDDVTLVCEAL